jgi:hypothetical protein
MCVALPQYEALQKRQNESERAVRAERSSRLFLADENKLPEPDRY